MPSTKKLTTYRTRQFEGPRRRKPKVRVLNRAVRERIKREHSLLQRVVTDAHLRAAVLRGHNRQVEPLLVWRDFDHTSGSLTKLNPKELPAWGQVGEYLKFHLMCQLGIWDGGYAFTANVRPDLEHKWKVEGRDPMDRIKRLVRKALGKVGLSDIEYCYVVETRSRTGKSRTRLHLHGMMLTRDPIVATRFKVALEQSLAKHPKGRAASGMPAKAGPEVDLDPLYDLNEPDDYGYGKWATYITKNATQWDQRFTRRVFISQSATKTLREFWALIREESLLIAELPQSLPTRHPTKPPDSNDVRVHGSTSTTSEVNR